MLGHEREKRRGEERRGEESLVPWLEEGWWWGGIEGANVPRPGNTVSVLHPLSLRPLAYFYSSLSETWVGSSPFPLEEFFLLLLLLLPSPRRSTYPIDLDFVHVRVFTGFRTRWNSILGSRWGATVFGASPFLFSKRERKCFFDRYNNRDTFREIRFLCIASTLVSSLPPFSRKGSRIDANEHSRIQVELGEGYARENVAIRACAWGGREGIVENLLKFLRRVRCPRSLHSTHSFAIHNNPYIYIYPPPPWIITSSVCFVSAVSMHLSRNYRSRIESY